MAVKIFFASSSVPFSRSYVRHKNFFIEGIYIFLCLDVYMVLVQSLGNSFGQLFIWHERFAEEKGKHHLKFSLCNVVQFGSTIVVLKAVEEV